MANAVPLGCGRSGSLSSEPPAAALCRGGGQVFNRGVAQCLYANELDQQSGDIGVSGQAFTGSRFYEPSPSGGRPVIRATWWGRDTTSV